MGVNSRYKGTCTSNAALVNKYVGTAYDHVKVVSDNIEDVKTVADALGGDFPDNGLDTLVENIDDVVTVATNIDDTVTVAGIKDEVVTVAGIEQEIIGVPSYTAQAIDAANAAEQDADRAEAAAELAENIADPYKGLWPDTSGSANKGDIYQTQVSGTPTGQYFTALQNTTVDPIGDNINWREVVSGSTIGAQEVIATGSTTPRRLDDRFADVINVKDYGVEGVITSSSQFQALTDYIVNNNIKNVKLLFPEKLTFNNPANYLVLDGLDSFIVDGLDIEDIHDYEATGNFTFTRLFDLTNTKVVSITNAVAESTLQSVQPSGEKKGFTFVRSDGGDLFKCDCTLVKGYRTFEVWNTKVVNGVIYTEDTRYSAVAQEGCGIVDFNISSLRTRRNFYVYGCGSANIRVDSEDQYGASPLILNVENDGEEKEMSNVDVYFKERGTLTLPDRAAPISLTLNTVNSAIGDAVARNISIEYDVVGDYGTVIDLSKYYNGVGDTASRGYVIDGLQISGRLESTRSENLRLINWADDINWYAGDEIRGVNFNNLNVDVASGYAAVLNMDRVLNALQERGAVKFNSSKIPQGFIGATDNYSDRVIFHKTNIRDYQGTYALESRKLLSKKDWVIESSTSSGVSVKVAQVDNERSLNFIRFYIKAHGNPESINSSWHGSIDGYVSYDASGTPSVRVQANEAYQNPAGEQLNPTITANTSGELFLSLPEWTSSTAIAEAEIYLDASVNYTQYTNIDNPYLVGLYSNKYDLTFGSGD